MKWSFHIYTCTQDCKDLFPQNFSGEHNIQLALPIRLTGKWYCGLVEVQLAGGPDEPVYVCCDLVKESSTGPFNIPILRQVESKTTEFREVTYVPLKQYEINTVQIFIRTLENRPLPQIHGANKGNSYCTLHFKQDV